MGYMSSCGDELAVPDVCVHGNTMGESDTSNGGHPNPSERVIMLRGKPSDAALCGHVRKLQ